MPLRGEIWYTKLPTDPEDKAPRPVVIVSIDERNRHPRAHTVMVVPLTTSIHKDTTTNMRLEPGETGLSEPSSVMGAALTTVMKTSLLESRTRLRRLSDTRICQIAQLVAKAMGC